MEDIIKKYSISEDASIMDALKHMDQIEAKLLIINNPDGKYKCLLSIGDIQRAILKKVPLADPVKTIVRPLTKVASTTDNLSVIKDYMLKHRNEFMPLVNVEGVVEKIIFYKEIFSDETRLKKKIGLPVVIMAGGMGTRLKPLTNVLPKPLIPIGEKTIIEDIIGKFTGYDCRRFYISVNYKADLIEYYLNSLNHCDFEIEYFKEDKPLGTAGSLILLKDKIDSTFFVSNCDIIIEQDYSEIVDYHLSNKNDITIVAALKNYKIPYGTLTTLENGLLDTLTEKPELTFYINTGFYILEPDLINIIPKNITFHITDLIEVLHKQKRRVGVFPVSEKSWIDIGNWNEYLKFVSK